MKRGVMLCCLIGSVFPISSFAHGGDEILAKNPQLSRIPDWPKRSSNTGSVGVPIDCNKCAKQESLDNMRRKGETPYRCVYYEGTTGGKAWESGAGENRQYTLQLYPNSPKVWRVYPQGGYLGDASKNNLIAEFDKDGKLLYSKSALSPQISLSHKQMQGDCSNASSIGSSSPTSDDVANTRMPRPEETPETNPQETAQKAISDAATKTLRGLFGR